MNKPFMFKVYARDGTIQAQTECPSCSYNINKLEWTETGTVFKRYTLTKVKQINYQDTDFVYTPQKGNSYFAKQYAQGYRRIR